MSVYVDVCVFVVDCDVVCDEDPAGREGLRPRPDFVPGPEHQGAGGARVTNAQDGDRAGGRHRHEVGITCS